MDTERLEFLKKYIERHENHLDRYMGAMIDPAGKRILVLGAGWGTETYWALKNGAEFVYGLDPAPRQIEPLLLALSAVSEELVAKFEHTRALIWEIPEEVEPFDAIISNNVVEHVFNLSANLAACKRQIPKPGGRVHIFTDPLFYSSAGSHLPVAPWAHLIESQASLLANLGTTRTNWSEYRHGLNGMTLTSFLEAVREAGMWIENMSVVPDRNRTHFNELLDGMPSGLKPMDLLLEGISCTLAFPQNI